MTIEEFKNYFKAEIDAVMKVAVGK
jgi:hypothetical protein